MFNKINLKNAIDKIKNSDKKSTVFISLIVVSVFVLVISLFFSLDLFFKFYFFELPVDTFGDFKNMLEILYYHRNPYIPDIPARTGFPSAGVSYPPFALLMYVPFFVFFVFEFISPLAPYYVAIVFYFLIPIIVIIFLYIKMLGKKPFLISALFFTFPFGFLLQRANVLIYCYMFIMLFLCYYKSENKKHRMLALVSLAAAAAMKIYPAIFLILLFIDGRFLDILKTVILFAVLFFLPFIFFKGGFANISNFFTNMSKFSDIFLNYSKIKFDNYSTVTLVQFAIFFIKGSIESASVILVNQIVVILLLCSTVFCCLVLKSGWKLLAILSICITGIPVVSFIYTQVFFIPAFILFLKTDNKTKKDIWYFILFLIILIPLNRFIFDYKFPALNWPNDFPWYYNNPYVDSVEMRDWQPVESLINTLIAVAGMLLMYLTVFVDSVVAFIKSIKKRGFCGATAYLFPFCKNKTAVKEDTQ